MTVFTLHTAATASPAAAAILEGAGKALGFVPNLYAHLANAPAALDAYRQLGALFDKTSLTPIEQQVVALAVSVENQCEYCVAAHSFLARNLAKMPEPIIQALRNQQLLPDARLLVLADFTKAVVRERGWVADSKELQRFFNAGFTQQQALEVLLGVTMKTLSNYANHLAATPLDAVFVADAWHKPACNACAHQSA